MRARISDEARRQTSVHNWQRETLRAAGILLALQFEVDAWNRIKRKPFCYDGTYSSMQSKAHGFRKRLARLQEEAAAGDAQQQKWMEDHAEILAAVSRDA
jgi:hypothetical protein